MFKLENLYRWCDGCTGGLVIAESEKEAMVKLIAKYGNERDVEKMIIWSWSIDDYFDEENPDVLDIYG